MKHVITTHVVNYFLYIKIFFIIKNSKTKWRALATLNHSSCTFDIETGNIYDFLQLRAEQILVQEYLRQFRKYKNEAWENHQVNDGKIFFLFPQNSARFSLTNLCYSEKLRYVRAFSEYFVICFSQQLSFVQLFTWLNG